MIEYRITTCGMEFIVQRRGGMFIGCDEWCDEKGYMDFFHTSPITLVFETAKDAEEYIDERLKERERRTEWEEKVKKFAEDNPTRVYP